MVERRTHKANAYRKDISRTVFHNLKRFISIAIIVTLGVMMFSALYASCMDLRKSADVFFDQQNLHDLSIVSTLGLTEEDINALSEAEGVKSAEGIYKENAAIVKNDTDYSVSLETIPDHLDQLYIKEGKLPAKSGEAAVSWKTAEDTGLKAGDTFFVQTEDEDNTGLKRKNYTVAAVVIDPTDITNPSGSMTFRNENIADKIFVLKEDLHGNVYAEARLTLENAEGFFCYSDEYTDLADQAKENIEKTIQKRREAARTWEVRQDAQDQVDDAVKEINEKLADAQAQIDDGQKELEDQKARGEADLSAGKIQLDEQTGQALKELTDAKSSADAQLNDALVQLQDGQSQLEEGIQKLDAGQAELNQKKQEADKAFADGQKQIDDNRNAVNEQLKTVNAQLNQTTQLINGFEDWPAEEWNSYMNTCKQANMQVAADAVQKGTSPTAVKVELPEEINVYAARKTQELQQAESLLTRENLQNTAVGIVENDASALQTETILVNAFPDFPAADWEAYKKAMKDAVSADPPKTKDDVPIPENLQKYVNEKTAQLNQTIQALSGLSSFAAGIAQLEDTKIILNQSLAQIEEGQKELDAQKSSAYAQINAAQSQIDSGREELEKNKSVLEQSWNDYCSGKDEADQKIADGWNQIEQGRKDGEAELADGRQKLEKGIAEGQQKLDNAAGKLTDSKAEAQDTIDDLQQQVDEIKPAQWYLYDRMALEGYSDVKSDADSIEAIGDVFPVLFLAVAVLICLTAVMRMVEEDRGLIGTYKSLGFHNHEIMKKYLWFSLGACTVGGILGTILAFIGLPSFIIVIFHIMYALPEYQLHFLPFQAVLGAGLFFACILITTVIACQKVLKETPASLMRPKSPKAGSKVFLERIPFIWKHLSFLNKVTARNIFRYKGRMFMTIIGVSGCMALLLFGFAIRDSVHDLNGRQYGTVFHYDILAAGASDDYDKIRIDMNPDQVESMTGLHIEQVTLNYEGKNISAQLMVIPDDAEISDYISFYDTKDHPVSLETGKILVTQNASNVLGFKEDDTLSMQRSNLLQAKISIDCIVRNYLSNYVYMRASTYEKYFEKYEPNGILAILKDSVDQRAFADELNKQKEVISVASAEKIKNDFTSAYLLIDVVVYVIIFMSAALAFTVLFTLSTTNISERERELATIKVLGFYDNEVHAYINKETWILTGIGILLGIPLGYAFAQTLTSILNLPAMYLAVSLHPVSYALCVLLTVLFALLVMHVMNKAMNKIDPVNALKSVE